MTAWREPYCPEDDPRCARPESAPAEISQVAPVPEDKQWEAAQALASVWPRRGRHYASLALCGALAKAGWPDEAIADFVHAVCQLASEIPGNPGLGANGGFEDRLAQARSSAEKVARGEDVSGWPTLVQHLCTGDDGQADEARAEKVGAAVLAARRPLGMGPPIELFEQARAERRTAASATSPEQIRAVLAASQVTSAAPGPESRAQLLAEATADAGDRGAEFTALLDDVATDLPPVIEQAESKSKTVDPRPMGMTYREMRARNLPPPDTSSRASSRARAWGHSAGEPKAAKSWDATYLAVCVAAGKFPFDRLAVQRPSACSTTTPRTPRAAVNNRVAAVARHWASSRPASGSIGSACSPAADRSTS
jgi:hypothetical protein